LKYINGCTTAGNISTAAQQLCNGWKKIDGWKVISGWKKLNGW
jgi:hypothetical protein